MIGRILYTLQRDDWKDIIPCRGMIERILYLAEGWLEGYYTLLRDDWEDIIPCRGMIGVNVKVAIFVMFGGYWIYIFIHLFDKIYGVIISIIYSILRSWRSFKNSFGWKLIYISSFESENNLNFAKYYHTLRRIFQKLFMIFFWISPI